MKDKPPQKAKQKSTKLLKAKAINIFNAWIRNRDNGQSCISCSRFTTLQAGHYHSAGKHSHMRFMEDNVHGQCLQCNYFLSGNLLNYRRNLIAKIGQEAVDKLDMIAGARVLNKDNRFLFEEVIEKYKL